MNILIINRLMGKLFGGGESFDYNAAKYLAKRGHVVTILTSGFDNRIEISESSSAVKVVRLYVPYLRDFSYKLQGRYRRLAALILHLDMFLFEISALVWIIWLRKARSFDVVHCCSMFILPKLIIKIFSMPVIAWLPGPPSKFTEVLISSLMKNLAFGLFTHGTPELSLMNKGFTRDREYSIIEPGIELEIIDRIVVDRQVVRESIGIGSNDLLGITTARLVPVKNHVLLFEAIAIAKTRGITWNWILIGNGPLQQKLKTQAEALGIGSQVHFLGYQAQSLVHRWLAVADIFALTSEYESFSIAALEAMAHRLPVIGTKVGYLQYLIDDAKAGIIVPLGQTESMASALIKMSDAKIRIDFGSGGRRYVEKLDWLLIAEKLERLYLKVFYERLETNKV